MASAVAPAGLQKKKYLPPRLLRPQTLPQWHIWRPQCCWTSLRSMRKVRLKRTVPAVAWALIAAVAHLGISWLKCSWQPGFMTTSELWGVGTSITVSPSLLETRKVRSAPRLRPATMARGPRSPRKSECLATDSSPFAYRFARTIVARQPGTSTRASTRSAASRITGARLAGTRSSRKSLVSRSGDVSTEGSSSSSSSRRPR
mmetsp:Transcript_26116/g.80340  ORF Transcript_26116/g.80340 Transcript_26116/m.80340 type:complete len:202 (-) Transcript_26116:460-1065(-)